MGPTAAVTTVRLFGQGAFGRASVPNKSFKADAYGAA
jgi:hypothetical protein